MNLDAKLMNKILANRILQVSKISYAMIKFASSQGCRDISTSTNY
jgi:hypothetical protein